MYYALFYEVVDDYMEKRGAFRKEHLALAQAAKEKGLLVMAGAFSAPADGALFIFKTDKIEKVEAFAENDPYVQNDLVKKWWIRPWTVVIGGA